MQKWKKNDDAKVKKLLKLKTKEVINIKMHREKH